MVGLHYDVRSDRVQTAVGDVAGKILTGAAHVRDPEANGSHGDHRAGYGSLRRDRGKARTGP